jgi:hypothetical protein
VTPGERSFQNRYAWGEDRAVRHLCRGTPIQVDVPSRTEWVVDLRLREKIDRPKLLPDLAIHARDVRFDAGHLIVSVHNIGGAASAGFEVRVEARAGDAWKPIASANVTGLKAIAKLEPVVQDVVIETGAASLANGYRVAIDPDGKVDELYELNNTVTIAR